MCPFTLQLTQAQRTNEHAVLNSNGLWTGIIFPLGKRVSVKDPEVLRTSISGITKDIFNNANIEYFVTSILGMVNSCANVENIAFYKVYKQLGKFAKEQPLNVKLNVI